jgi:DNA polymerase III delta prime subunit
MIFQRLRVFVSSKMQELAPERQALKAALDALKVDAWVFEQDAGARPVSIEKAFLEEVEAADLYIGLFWKGYGDYTIEEYEHARKRGKDCLIYEKRAALNGDRDPRLQEFLDRLGNVEKGLTIKWFDDPLQLSEAIKDDVARWQTAKIRERVPPRINVNLSLAEKRERDELLILLRKVKKFWVEGVLEKSVHGQALIDLGKKVWTEKTEHPWEQILELPDQTSRTLEPGEPIDRIFDEVGRSLLILGAPGSGKTITLLALARELIGRAEDDPAQPIPVIFNLSSWNDSKQNLLDWLVEDLLVKYQIPRDSSRRWLRENWLVPLLDGLDEVVTANRSACVAAINAYMESNGVPGLVVCSRLKEYTDLPVRSHVTGAICLQPLTQEQVRDYAARSGNALGGLSAALEKDQVLRTLAETPLMLDVMSMAYRDLPAEELTSAELNTEKERRSHLFDTYIDKMFSRKGKGTQEYAREHTLSWLNWLAVGVLQHRQSIFLIEQLQPSWLENQRHRLVYILGSRLIFGFILGWTLGLATWVQSRSHKDFIAGLILLPIGGLAFGLIDMLRFRKGTVWAKPEKASARWQTVLLALVYGLSFALSVGLISFLFQDPSDDFGEEFLNILAAGLVYGLFWGIRSKNRTLTNDIQCVESLRWSWVQARKGLVSGLIVGLIIGLLIGEVLGFVLAGLTIGAFFGGLRTGIIDTKPVPNLGVKLSIRNALVTGGGAGLAIFVMFLPIIAWNTVLFVALILGANAMLWYGGLDVIQHYILRFFLYWKGHMPLHYANFLDYATRLVFLQKVGGGYIFIHRLLLEHFAAMRKDEKKPLVTS